MNYNFEKISEEVQKENFKIFTVPEFKSQKKVKSLVLNEMPDYQTYLLNKKKLKQKSTTCVDFHLEEPVLNKQQEFHLFRKMHYYKNLCKDIFNKYLKNKKNYLKDNLIDAYSSFQEVRHMLHKANVKLVSQALKKRKDFYGSNNIGDLFSDAFMNILQAIDHFDYRRNIKFSTFACWCLLNNSIRDHQKTKRFEFHNLSNCDSSVFEKFDENGERVFSSFDNKESSHFDWIKIKDYFLKTNKNREIVILEKVFGLGGSRQLSIAEIADEFNLTKERIRQLREKTLIDIRKFVKTGKIKIDGL